MKLLTKITLIAATFAALGTSAAFADNQQLQNQLTLQRQAAQRNQTTVAVYGHHRGVGRSSTTQERRSESRFELRSTAHGQTNGAYVPVK